MTDAEFLAVLPVLAFHGVLAFARIGAAVIVMPGLGESGIPATVRLGLGMGILVLVLPGLTGTLPQAPDSSAEAARLIVIEAVIGLWIGTLARFIAIAMGVAGQVISLLLGLSQAMVPDPQLGGQASATGRMFSLATAVLVLATGLYVIPLKALIDSYTILPAGGVFPAGPSAEALVRVAGQSMELALRIASPFVVMAILINVSLGLMTRIAPQVQIYFIAIPGQILLGVTLLASLLPSMFWAFQESARAAFLALPGAD